MPLTSKEISAIIRTVCNGPNIEVIHRFEYERYKDLRRDYTNELVWADYNAYHTKWSPTWFECPRITKFKDNGVGVRVYRPWYHTRDHLVFAYENQTQDRITDLEFRDMVPNNIDVCAVPKLNFRELLPLTLHISL